jgi:hypothetical protein
MEINQAQKDVRETFLGGFAGQLVSALLWGTSAAVCTWGSLHLGEVVLVLGGFLIFPSTQLVLRSMGHAYALPKGHPMNALGIQVAFTLLAHTTPGDRHCGFPTRPVLPRLNDRFGSPLLAVCIHVRHVAVWCPVRNLGR